MIVRVATGKASAMTAPEEKDKTRDKTVSAEIINLEWDKTASVGKVNRDKAASRVRDKTTSAGTINAGQTGSAGIRGPDRTGSAGIFSPGRTDSAGIFSLGKTDKPIGRAKTNRIDERDSHRGMDVGITSSGHTEIRAGTLPAKRMAARPVRGQTSPVRGQTPPVRGQTPPARPVRPVRGQTSPVRPVRLGGRDGTIETDLVGRVPIPTIEAALSKRMMDVRRFRDETEINRRLERKTIKK
jgi:hypothetical protein